MMGTTPPSLFMSIISVNLREWGAMKYLHHSSL